MEAEAMRQGRGLEQLMDDLQAQMTRWGPPADPRVKSAFAMAPLTLAFDEAGAGTIDRPVFLYYGDADRVLRPDENAGYFGCNLDAFWDALHGGPGWSGECVLRFTNTAAVEQLRDGDFLPALSDIANESKEIRVELT